MSKVIYKALIVDDEILAQEDLQSVLSKVKNIEIVGNAKNLTEARNCIKYYKPNLIFLDIEMRGEIGFDLLKDIDKKIRIIFVTAYNEYAIKAFEVGAFDYLLKPVTFERLITSIDRLHIDSSKENEENLKMNFDDKIFIQINGDYHFLPISEILLIEAEDYYSKIYTKDGKKSLILKSLKKMGKFFTRKSFSTNSSLLHC